MILAGAAWGMCACIKETYAPSILKRKAAAKRKDTGDDRYWCRYDNHMSCMSSTQIRGLTLTSYSGTASQGQSVTAICIIIYRTHLVVLERLYCCKFSILTQSVPRFIHALRFSPNLNRLSENNRLQPAFEEANGFIVRSYTGFYISVS